MIKVGIVGLGRLGKVHAENIAKRVPSFQLEAACSLNETELEYAKNELNVSKLYSTYEDMVDNGGIDAVVIVSPSNFHTKQIRYAMEAGLHVFAEKPIGLDVDDIKKTLEVIEKHPQQMFFLGFMRRYDESFRYAKELVDKGEIGEITYVRAYGIDPSTGMESFVKFAREAKSGGLFLDMSVHDIDVLRWFTNDEPQRMWAIGNNKAYPELDGLGELETGAALIQMKNKVMAVLVAGRNAPHGYHIELEVMGTKGMLRVGNTPEKNLVTVYNQHGVVRPTSQNFPERFREAFVNEMNAFAESIETKQSSPFTVTAYDGLQATKIGLALQKAFDANEIVTLD